MEQHRQGHPCPPRRPDDETRCDVSAATKRWIPLTDAVYDAGMSGIRLGTQAILTKLLHVSHNDEGVVRLPVDVTLVGSLRKFCPSATLAEVRRAVAELTNEDDPLVAFEGGPFVRVARVLDPLRWLAHMGPGSSSSHESARTRPDVRSATCS